MRQKMNTKNVLVSFVTLAAILVLATVVSAHVVTSGDLADVTEVQVEDVSALTGNAAIIAGENVRVEVYFTALENDTYVTIEAKLEGDKVDTSAITTKFDVEAGKTYKKVLTLKVPYELKDDVSDDIYLNLEIDGKDYNTEVEDVLLRVQRPSFNADVMSIGASSTVNAGETFPVEVVLKNRGYNNLDDVYVTARIPALGIESSGYLGDIVALESDSCDECHDEDETDTISGRLYLKVPYGTQAGVYALEVVVKNDDTTNTEATQIVVENALPNEVIATTTTQTVAVGQNAEYALLIVNPTNTLRVYRIVTESSGNLASNANQAVIAVPAGSSETVKITAKATAEGQYNFNVNVLAGDKLVESVKLSANVEGGKVTNPITVLTIVLGIVFLVLVIVLIVLVTRKPEKEEFGESYY